MKTSDNSFIKLDSEFGKLKQVLMHRPGKEIDRLNPENLDELLFNDIPFLPLLQKEHDDYVKLIKEVSGAKVHILNELLTDILTDESVAEEIFQTLLEPYGLKELAGEILEKHSTAQTAFMLTSGLSIRSLKKRVASSLLDKHAEHTYLISPKPNMYFTRDPAAFTQGGVIVSKMHYPARQGESYLLNMIFKYHTDFKDSCKRIELPDTNNPTIEGGDVIILSNKAIAIGNSERTNSQAITYVAEYLIGNGFVERVYEVLMPKVRTFMHLDTVFTMIDENLVVTYMEAMKQVQATKIHFGGDLEMGGKRQVLTEMTNENLINVLKREIPYLEVIETAFGNPDYSSREQYFDGANVFALAPRKVICYNRNSHTNRALIEADVDVYEISSSELSRGLGGPRCMTMSVERKTIYRA